MADVDSIKSKVLILKSGATFRGQLMNGKKEGHGHIQWYLYCIIQRPDGSTYDGNWRDDKAHGKGKFTYPDGDVYEGEWENDKANGFGVYRRENGGKYEGFWRDDLQEGQGYEEWYNIMNRCRPDGSKYEGNFYDGIKQGEGTYYWKDGSLYRIKIFQL